MLVDSHCHLDFPDLFSQVPEVLDRAAAAGVGMMVTISTKMSTLDRVVGLAETYDNIYCTVGVHPHEAASHADLSTEHLVRLSAHEKIIGIGETGLDYYYDNSPRDIQRTLFRRHIAAARITGLPLIVHTRDADEDTIAILREEAEKGAFPGLIHCFSAGRTVAEGALEIGFYISVSGIATFKQADSVRDVLADVPIDRLLVETDAPFLAPVPVRGRTNEPAYVAHTAAKLANIKGLAPDALALATTDNFFTLFTKAARPA